MKRAVTILAVALSLTILSASACGTTPGSPATATLRMAPANGTFTTASGWQVVLDEAVLVLGSVYVYAPDGDVTAVLERALLPVAYAHAGHDPFGSRPVRLEWLGPVSIDLLSPEPATLGPMDGSVGAATEATLAFEALDGALADPSGASHGHHAWIHGTAERASGGTTERIVFEGGLDFASGGTENLIEAVSAGATIASQGIETLHADLPRWLDQAHFDRLSDTGGTREVAPTSQVAIAWELGLRDPAGYRLEYVPALAD